MNRTQYLHTAISAANQSIMIGPSSTKSKKGIKDEDSKAM
jgi:hypothetical protein